MKEGIFTYLLFVLIVHILFGEIIPASAQKADTSKTPPIIKVSQT